MAKRTNAKTSWRLINVFLKARCTTGPLNYAKRGIMNIVQFFFVLLALAVCSQVHPDLTCLLLLVVLARSIWHWSA